MNAISTGFSTNSVFFILIAALLIIVGVLWFFLPFAVFGLKPLLRDLASAGAAREQAILTELKAIRELLEERRDP